LYKQKNERTPPREIHQVELSACRRRIEDNYEKNRKDGQRDIWCGGKKSGGPFSYGISLVPWLTTMVSMYLTWLA